MQLDEWQKDSNEHSSTVKALPRKHPKLSNYHNSNFRIRLYHELNVINLRELQHGTAAPWLHSSNRRFDEAIDSD